MDPVLSPYDEPSEDVTASVDTAGWQPGTYKLYVYAWDDAQPEMNYNSASNLFATVVILNTPSNVQIGSPTEEGKLTISWDHSQSDIINGFKVYRSTTSGSGYVLAATLDSSQTSYTDSDLDNEATYYYAISAIDSKGAETSLSDEASATTIPSEEPGTDEGEGSILWLIVVLTVIFILIIILFLWLRKRA
jgi:fibronectin type 3 domain-containing protein